MKKIKLDKYWMLVGMAFIVISIGVVASQIGPGLSTININLPPSISIVGQLHLDAVDTVAVERGDDGTTRALFCLDIKDIELAIERRPGLDGFYNATEDCFYYGYSCPTSNASACFSEFLIQVQNDIDNTVIVDIPDTSVNYEESNVNINVNVGGG